MADVTPYPAFAAGGFGAGGQTAPFSLPPGAVFLASVVTAVAGSSPALQVFLDVAEGVNWVQLAGLDAQTAAGAESAAAYPPAGGPAGPFRLRWTVTGSGAMFSGKAFAAVAG